MAHTTTSKAGSRASGLCDVPLAGSVTQRNVQEQARHHEQHGVYKYSEEDANDTTPFLW